MSKDLVPSHLLVPAGTGSLDAYIQEVNKIPVLTLEEEQDLARRYRDDGDLEAARRIVLEHEQARRDWQEQVDQERAAREALEARLADLGRSDWPTDDLEALVQPALYEPDPAGAWRRVTWRQRSAP
mgnify:CR=1 FL=1